MISIWYKDCNRKEQLYGSGKVSMLKWNDDDNSFCQIDLDEYALAPPFFDLKTVLLNHHLTAFINLMRVTHLPSPPLPPNPLSPSSTTLFSTLILFHSFNAIPISGPQIRLPLSSLPLTCLFPSPSLSIPTPNLKPHKANLYHSAKAIRSAQAPGPSKPAPQSQIIRSSLLIIRPVELGLFPLRGSDRKPLMHTQLPFLLPA